jgi:hypothetical protein
MTLKVQATTALMSPVARPQVQKRRVLKWSVLYRNGALWSMKMGTIASP